MYSMKHMWKIKKYLPAIFFTIGVFILYNRFKINHTDDGRHVGKNNREKERSMETDFHFIPTDPPVVNAWVIAFTDADICLSVATAFTPWTVFLVGNVKEPSKELRHSRCIYSSSIQEPANSQLLSLRQLAFLFAIEKGAQAIYILPHDKTNNVEFPAQLHLESAASGMVVFPGGMFHPVRHWGCNVSSAKGFPQEVPLRQYRLCNNMMPAIQAYAHQVVDAIGIDPKRVLHNLEPERSCDTSSPAVILSHDTGAYFEPKGTLYLKNAFWALAFTEANNTKERFYLSFLTQRLLALSGQHFMVYLGHTIPLVQGNLNMPSEHDLNSIMRLHCVSDNFLDCIVELTEKMKNFGYIHQETLSRISVWMQLLLGTRYTVKMWTDADDEINCMQQHLNYQPVDYNVTYSIKKWKPEPFPPINNIKLTLNLHKQICKDASKDNGVRIDFYAPWVQWENTLLIIVFNNPLYQVIPYTELLYRSFFPRILYCGPGSVDNTMLKGYNFSFVSFGVNPAGHSAGSFSYRCLSMAVKMNYKVSGYFVIADDVLVIPEKLQRLNPDKAWYLPSKEIKTADMVALRECRLGMCDFHTHWRWWEDYQSATIHAFKELQSKRNESRIVHQCHRALQSGNGGSFHANGAYSDVFYIPSHWSKDFATLADIFLKHYVFVEIAVPTIIKCLVPEGETAQLVGKQIWDESRDKSWVHFTKRDMLYQSYLHPTKWGYVHKRSEQYREFLCNSVSYIHDPYGRINKIQGL